MLGPVTLSCDSLTGATQRRIWVAHFAHAIRCGAHSGTGEVWEVRQLQGRCIITLATGRVPPRNGSSAERSGGPTPYRGDRRRSPQRLAGGTLVGCFRPQRSRSVSSWIGNSVRAQPTCGQAPRAVLRNPVLLSTVVRTTPVTLRPWSDPEVRRRGERWLQDVALRTSRTRQSWKGWSDPRDERHR